MGVNHLAFEHHGKFLYVWRIHPVTFYRCETCNGKFVRFSSRLNPKIIGFPCVFFSGNADCICLLLHNVSISIGGLSKGDGNAGWYRAAYSAPRGGHNIGFIIGIIGADHKNRRGVGERFRTYRFFHEEPPDIEI